MSAMLGNFVLSVRLRAQRHRGAGVAAEVRVAALHPRYASTKWSNHVDTVGQLVPTGCGPRKVLLKHISA